MRGRNDLDFSTHGIFKIWNLYFRWGFSFFYIFKIAKKLVCCNDKSTWSLLFCCCCCLPVLRCFLCRWEAVVLFVAFKVWWPVLISSYDTPLWKSSCSWLRSCSSLRKSQLTKGQQSCYLIKNWAPCSTHAMFLDGVFCLATWFYSLIHVFAMGLLSLLKMWASNMQTALVFVGMVLWWCLPSVLIVVLVLSFQSFKQVHSLPCMWRRAV